MIEDTIADQLVYSTVRLKCYNSTLLSLGTAFFIQIPFENRKILSLVTNKHVVTIDDQHTQFYEKAELILTKSDSQYQPLDTEHTTINIDSLSSRCFFHPDKEIDLCFIFISDLINAKQKSGEYLYFRYIGEDFFISETAIKNLTPIEDIVMIGYPIGLIDEKNNKPVVRKGITASDVRLNYNNREEFLIDAACFCGSSGSPIFLRKMGLGKEKIPNGVTLAIVPSYAFLGLLYAGPVQVINGEIKIKTIPTSNVLYSEVQSTINLGYVIKANVISDLFGSTEFQKFLKINSKFI